jgi:pimeloyl-ACP methyl ester carboxylesterase
MQTHTVEGGGELKLHVREWGKPNAQPILFIHGWSQNHLCWSKQCEGPLAGEFRLVSIDIRGHGQSDAPLAAENYTTGALWADDVNNVIEALNLEKPILVGWSYGGLIISDYIRSYGDEDIAGVNFVGAAVGIGARWFGTRIGPGFLDYAPLACSEDQTVALNAALNAIRDFLHVCFVKPIAAGEMELAMGWNMLVHPQVRANLIGREEDFTPDLAKMKKPVLVTYGDADTLALPSMVKVIQNSVQKCQTSEYPGVGHAPFIEEPVRFNAELDAFARQNLGIV